MSDLDNKNSEAGAGAAKPARKRSPLLWAVVGAYLIYTSYNLVKNIMDEGGIDGSNFYFIIAAVAFTAVAVFLFVRSFKEFKASKEKNDRDYAEYLKEEQANKEQAGSELDSSVPIVGSEEDGYYYADEGEPSEEEASPAEEELPEDGEADEDGEGAGAEEPDEYDLNDDTNDTEEE